MNVVYIGIGAGILTSTSLVPQLVKILREKKAGAISVGMFLTLLAGVAGWIWYGIEKNDYPVLLTNCFSFILNALIIFFSIKYKQKEGG